MKTRFWIFATAIMLRFHKKNKETDWHRCVVRACDMEKARHA